MNRSLLGIVVIAFFAIGCAGSHGNSPEIPQMLYATDQHFSAATFRHTLDNSTDVGSPGAVSPYAGPTPGIHKLSQSEALSIIDPTSNISDIQEVTAVLTGTGMSEFDPSAGSEDYDIAVIDSNTNQIYYNKPSLKGTISLICTLAACQGSSETTPSVAEPQLTTTIYPYTPTQDSGSGAFRRLISTYNQSEQMTSGNGESFYYSPYETGLVDAYCQAGVVITPAAGYVYMGGWSASGGAPSTNAPPNSAVDAGLQYNLTYLRGQKTFPSDSYSPFLHLSTTGYAAPTFLSSGAGAGGSIPNAFDFGCGQQIRNSFFVGNTAYGNTQNAITLTEAASGINPQTGAFLAARIYFVGTIGQTNYSGWSLPCDDCVFKYAVSIGQPPGKENLDDGSTFYSQWEQLGLTCGFYQNCLNDLGSGLGNWSRYSTLNCTEWANWQAKFDPGTRDCTTDPNPRTDNVVVQGFAYNGDVVQIFDRVATPKPTAKPTPTLPPLPKPTATATSKPCPTLPVVRTAGDSGVEPENAPKCPL